MNIRIIKSKFFIDEVFFYCESNVFLYMISRYKMRSFRVISDIFFTSFTKPEFFCLNVHNILNGLVYQLKSLFFYIVDNSFFTCCKMPVSYSVVEVIRLFVLQNTNWTNYTLHSFGTFLLELIFPAFLSWFVCRKFTKICLKLLFESTWRLLNNR